MNSRIATLLLTPLASQLEAKDPELSRLLVRAAADLDVAPGKADTFQNFDLLLQLLEVKGWQPYFALLDAAQLGVAGYWWLANSSLQNAMLNNGAVLSHWIPGLQIVCLEQSTGIRIRLVHEQPVVACFGLVLLITLIQQVIMTKPTFSAVLLPHSQLSQLRWISDCAHELVASDLQQAEIVVSQQHWKAPFKTGNPRLLTLFSAELPFIRATDQDSLLEQVYGLFEQAANLGSVNQSQIAAKLAMSERTLTRQLALDGVNFRELFTRFRNAKAISGLCGGESIDRLTDYLGFSERAAFERAFKSWQGITPAKFQAQYRRLCREVNIEAVISIERLPNMPAIAAQLLAMTQEENVSLEAMAKVVEQDPVLSAKLLSIASSAYYGLKVGSSIKDAVVRVFGVVKLRYLALAVLAGGSFNQRHCPAFSLQRFWLCSLGVAQLATELFKAAGRSEEEQADIYLAGLLHNIGRLVLVECFPVRMQALLASLPVQPPPQELLAMEKLKLGVDSSEAGALLMAKWQLPRSVSMVMRQLAVEKCAMAPEAKLLTLLEEFLLVVLADEITQIDDSARIGSDSVTAALDFEGFTEIVEATEELTALPAVKVNQIFKDFTSKLAELRAVAEVLQP